MQKWLDRMEGKELKAFSLFSLFVLFAAFLAFLPDGQAGEGMKRIVYSRDALITDYFELAGYSASFLNAALVFGIGLFLLWYLKVSFTGLTMAALFINAGYALWGKNPINILPILTGTFFYAKLHKSSMGRYIYTALFGTCLAPFVTEMVFLLPFSKGVNLVFAMISGLFIGFVLPPLSMHTASMHMGYNLFNVGFSAGILAFVMVSTLKSFGLESGTVLIWKTGRPVKIAAGMYGFFLLTFSYGLLLCRGRFDRLRKIMKHPGRAVADFVLMDGAGATLMNMGLVGAASLTYILLVGGDLSGPVVGAILTAFGFSAFGAHLKNYLPVLAGVYLSTLVTQFDARTPGLQLASAFAVGLAPIAGQFGIAAGVAAGMLHSFIVMCTAGLYGGLNLYNNGFSAGWVAIFMVPMLESFMKQFRERKRRRA